LLKVFSEGIDFNPLTILERLVSRYEVKIDEDDSKLMLHAELGE